MIKPPRLKKGDAVGLVAPSGPFRDENKKQVEGFKSYLEEVGLTVRLSDNFYAIDKYGAAGGTPEQRAEDINSMFKDKAVNVVWCLQGGYTANQTLDLLDFDLIKKNPKIFLGKSDIDVLSLSINKMTGLVTFHGPDTKIGGDYDEMDPEYTKDWFKKRLFEGSKEIEPSSNWITLREGVAEGRLIGCNIDSILNLAGTKFFPDFENAILFLETYKIASKALLSKLQQLTLIGVFKKIKGIVVGTNFGFDDLGKNLPVEQIVTEITKDYKFPVLKIGEFGHYQPHAFLPVGVKVKLDATNKKVQIAEDFLS